MPRVLHALASLLADALVTLRARVPFATDDASREPCSAVPAPQKRRRRHAPVPRVIYASSDDDALRAPPSGAASSGSSSCGSGSLGTIEESEEEDAEEDAAPPRAREGQKEARVAFERGGGPDAPPGQ